MSKTENEKFDLFYLNEDGKSQVKESFKFIVRVADETIRKFDAPEVADVGCATGDLVAYLHSCYPAARLTGLDIQAELLEKARREVPSATFHEFDLIRPDQNQFNKFDVIFMCGVHAAFDFPDEWLPNFLKLLKPGGTAFVYGNFNPEPVDVIVRVRPSGSTGEFMRNWNMISQETVTAYLGQLGFRSSFTKFEIPIDIPKRPAEPLRSWTFHFKDGHRGTINGAQLLHQDFLMQISR